MQYSILVRLARELSVLLLIVGTFLFLLPKASFGQADTASLQGVVEDEQSAAVSNATVTIVDAGRGFRRTTQTNIQGVFVFVQLPASTYDLRVERHGFSDASVPRVVLNANAQRSLRVPMKVASRNEEIVVTAEAPLVSLSPAVATAVDRTFIEAQPLNGRSFQTLINLAPGVVLAPAGLTSMGQFSVNGQRTNANYFTVDGVGANFGMPSATSPYEGAGGSIPAFSSQGGTSSLASVDAVQEFTVQTSTYAPEYGRSPGAQVAIVTRSGTNDLHGSAFNYFRNDKLDANSWFGNYAGIDRPAMRQNDFGLTIGGPIFVPKFYDGSNRTFFFVSYEGLRLRQPVVLTGLRVPSMEARESATGAVRSLLEAYPLPIAAPFANAPLETPYSAGYSNPSNLNATSFRIDHAVTLTITVFGRYNHAPSQTDQRARYVTASFVAQLPTDTDTATFGSTMAFSPTVNNDLRVNWSESMAAQTYVQDTFGGAKILSDDILFPSFAPEGESLYYLSVGGGDEDAITPGAFSRNTQRQFNIVDSMNWIAGTHSLKFGFDYRRLSPSIGGRTYSKFLTAGTITQLATGIVPAGEIRQTDGYLEPRYHNFSFYAQDEWRISPTVTLTYGIRWELNPAPGNVDTVTVTGLDYPGSAQLTSAGAPFYQTAFDNFAPRIGVAFQPFGNRGMVVRAGYGLFYDLGSSFIGTALSPSNYPFTRTRVVTNTYIQDPVFFSEALPLNPNPPYPRLFAFDEGYQLPRSHQYSFAVEQSIGASNSFSVAYVGSAVRKLGRVESLRSQYLQNPDFTRIDLVDDNAYSDYNSLQAQYKRRFSRGFQALVSYTWAKSLDTASDDSSLGAPSSRLPVDLDRGPSSFDIRHQMTASASYEIPSSGENPFARAVLGGFALDGIFRARTASPVTVTTGRDPLGLGLTTVSRPDLIPGVPLYLKGDGYPGGKIFNRAAFDGATPLAQGRQGTLGRGVMRGFGFTQVDLSIRRRFALGERTALDFRADAFNLLNTPNFANPSGNLASANFGRSTQILSSGLGGQNPLFQVGGPRSIQLALRLSF